MLVREAQWIGKVMRREAVLRKIQIMNLGSSTSYFRSVEQPYVDEYIFAPIARDPGNRIVHCDYKSEPGVDVVADLTSEDCIETLDAYGCDTFLLSNVLEHVESIDQVLRNIEKLVRDGKTLIASGPLNFPYHPDPIDNMFRPSERDLRSLFSSYYFDEYKVVRHTTLIGAVQGSTRSYLGATRNLLRSVDVGALKERFRPFQPVSAWCALLRAK